jgi:Bacterial conjugation TrbI-like protein
MDTHQNAKQNSNEPSVNDLASILDLDQKDAVTSQYSTDTDFDDQIIDVESISDDEIFNTEFNPERNRTRFSLQRNGFAKTAVVVGGTLAIIGGGVMVFQGQLPKGQVAEEIKKKDPATEKVETAQLAATKAQQSESETKAELALSKQRDSLAQANNNKSNDPGKVVTPSSAVDSSSKEVVNVGPVVSPALKTSVVKSAPSVVTENSRQTRLAPIVAQSIPRNNPAAIETVPTRKAQAVSIARSAPRVASNTKQTTAAPVYAARLESTPVVAKPEVARSNNTGSSFQPIAKVDNTSKNRPDNKPRESLRAALPTSEQPDQVAINTAEERRIQAVRPPGVSENSAPNVAREVAINNSAPARVENPSVSYFQPSNNPGSGNIAINNLPSVTSLFQKTANQAAAPIAQVVSDIDKLRAPAALADVKSVPITQVAVDANKLKTSPSAALDIAKSGVAPQVPTSSATMAAAKNTEPVLQSAGWARNAFGNGRILIASAPGSKISLANTPQYTPGQDKSNGKEQGVRNFNPSLNIPTKASETKPLLASSILTGTSVKSSTLTPILWGGNGTSNARFVLKLDEPMLANNQQVVLPAGTQLIAMAKPDNSNVGIAEVEIVSVVVEGQEYATPAGALIVRDDQNGLLVGEDYFKREEKIAGRDPFVALGGALSTVGQIMNRPVSTYNSTNTGIGSSNTNVVTNREPSIMGAVLEGAFKDLPSIWSQRNQQALTELANQPKIYQIPKGRSVRVFVNQPINF